MYNAILNRFARSLLIQIFVFSTKKLIMFFWQICRLTRKNLNKLYFNHVLFTFANMPSIRLHKILRWVNGHYFTICFFGLSTKWTKHCNDFGAWPTNCPRPIYFIKIYVIIEGFGASKASESFLCRRKIWNLS